LIVCHNHRGRIENHKFKNCDYQKLTEDAVSQDSPGDCITINFGQDIGKNIDERKVVDGNRQWNAHAVNQLAGRGNANDGEEHIPKKNVVQEFIVLHVLTLYSPLSSKLLQMWKSNFSFAI
jgi:hypothetical protein